MLAALSDPARGAAPARLVHHAVQGCDRGAINLQAPRAAAEAAGRGAHREAHAQWQLALREGVPADDGERTHWLDGAWQAHYFSAPEFVEHVVALGLADRASLAEMSDAWRAWGEDPAAFSAAFWCEAVGWVA